MAAKGKARVFFELLGGSMAVLAVLTAPMAFVIAIDRSCGPDEAIIPALMRVRRWSNEPPIMPFAVAAVFALLAWRRAWPSLSSELRWKKIALVGGALAAQAVALLAAVILQLSFDPHWLFPPAIPTVRTESPDGKRVAWAALDCFFLCSWNVYVQEAGALKMKRVIRTPETKESPGGIALEWEADSSQVKFNPTPTAP